MRPDDVLTGDDGTDPRDDGTEDGAVDASTGDDAMDAAVDLDAADPMDADGVMDVTDARDATDAADVRDAAPDAPVVVPGCTTSLPSCPTTPTLTENGGLRATNHCAFRLADRNLWNANAALITRLRPALPLATVTEVVDSANREAVEVTSLARVPGFRQGFRWNDGDNDVAYWYPQGITGTADAAASGMVGNRRAVLVSWYDNGEGGPNRGARVSFANVASTTNVNYRHALLVELYDDGTRVNYRPVDTHAGGIAWYGRYLYVAQTGTGFRVFDMENILRVPGDAETIGYDATTRTYSAAGYRYIIPQVDIYGLSDSCPARFSFVALDRSTTPHSLVSGEYETPTIGGRVMRWNLDPTTGRLAAPYGARQAYFSQQSRVQGAVSYNGTWWLSCSSQVSSNGAIYRTQPGSPSREFTQPNGVEDLYHDPVAGVIWGLTEHPGSRYVYAMSRTSL